MANELEQKARELLAAELRRIGPEIDVLEVLLDEYVECPNISAAIRAAIAALQQAQQPSEPMFTASMYGSAEVARKAHEEWKAQQPGAQAVAWEVRRTDLCANGRWEACTHDAYLDTIATGRYCGFKKGPSAEGRALYTDPPPLPEGVSELRKVAKRNLRSLIEVGSADKALMLKCLEELS